LIVEAGISIGGKDVKQVRNYYFVFPKEYFLPVIFKEDSGNMFFVAPSVVVWVKEEPHTLEHLLQIPQMTQSAFYLRFWAKKRPE
jgi:hypothetical protein